LEVLRAVTEDEAVRPRRLQPHIPRDLEAITLRCLEKEPARRYPSALALAEDLWCFQQGKPIRARPVSRLERVRKWARRQPAVAALTLTVLGLVLLGTVAAPLVAFREAGLRGDAEARAADARAAEARATQLANSEGKLRRDALYQAYRARIAAAGAALQNHDVVDAARQLEATPEELRGWEWRHLSSRLDDSSAVIPLPAEKASLLSGSPDGLRAWAVTNAGLRLIDLEGGAPRTLPIGPARGHVVTARQTRRGLRILAWVGNTTLDLLDEAGQVVCRVDLPEAKDPDAVSMSSDGRWLAYYSKGNGRTQIRVFDATSGKQTAVCEGHLDEVWGLSFSPDGSRLASAGDDQTARLWDPATGALLVTCRGHTNRLLDVEFSPDGMHIVTAGSDGTVRQWDAATGREIEAPYDRHTGEVAAAVYSPDGQWVASGGTDRTVRVWRAAGRDDVAILHGHTEAVIRVAFRPGGRRLASASLRRDTVHGWARDDTVRVWEVDPGATLPVLRSHTRKVYPVAFSPDGLRIASGSYDQSVRLWDAATGEPCATLSHPGYVLSLVFSPDGQGLVTGSLGDDRLRIWDVATARVRKEIQGPGQGFRFLTVSPDGKKVAATADPVQMCVCDLTSGERLFATQGRPLAYSPDGRWLAIVRAADEKTVVLLDARTHEAVAGFHGHDQDVQSATFSPDSRLLATCSLDRTVRLWEIDPLPPASSPGEGREASVTKCRVLRGHTDHVFAAAFHPGGTRLATAGRDRAVWLWDLVRGEEVARLQGHTSWVWSLAFSPDGKTLVSGSGDGTVRLWDTEPLRLRYQTRRALEALRPEAERLVERLLQEKKEASRVAQALKDDKELSELLRRAAFHALLRRAQANH
jgi:WD40 repeat protein